MGGPGFLPPGRGVRRDAWRFSRFGGCVGCVGCVGAPAVAVASDASDAPALRLPAPLFRMPRRFRPPAALSGALGAFGAWCGRIFFPDALALRRVRRFRLSRPPRCGARPSGGSRSACSRLSRAPSVGRSGLGEWGRLVPGVAVSGSEYCNHKSKARIKYTLVIIIAEKKFPPHIYGGKTTGEGGE